MSDSVNQKGTKKCIRADHVSWGANDCTAVIIDYLRETGKVMGSYSPLVFQALRAFWAPFALAEQGASEAEVRKAALESYNALQQQVFYLKMQFGLDLPFVLVPGLPVVNQNAVQNAVQSSQFNSEQLNEEGNERSKKFLQKHGRHAVDFNFEEILEPEEDLESESESEAEEELSEEDRVNDPANLGSPNFNIEAFAEHCDRICDRNADKMNGNGVENE